jgi:hypothetical protein
MGTLFLRSGNAERYACVVESIEEEEVRRDKGTEGTKAQSRT